MNGNQVSLKILALPIVGLMVCIAVMTIPQLQGAAGLASAVAGVFMYMLLSGFMAMKRRPDPNDALLQLIHRPQVHELEQRVERLQLEANELKAQLKEKHQA